MQETLKGMNHTININRQFKAIAFLHEPLREGSPVKKINSRGKGRARIKDLGEDMDGTSFQSIRKQQSTRRGQDSAHYMQSSCRNNEKTKTKK